MRKYIFAVNIILLITVCAIADDSERLEKLLKKIYGHSQSIKTIRMKVEEKFSRPGKPTLNQKYNIVYRRKDDHWLSRFAKEHIVNSDEDNSIGEWVGSNKKKTVGVKELIDDNRLIFHTKHNAGIIEKSKTKCGVENIQLFGLGSLETVKDVDERVRSRIQRSKTISIEDTTYNGLNICDVNVKKKNGLNVRMCFVPEWQYGLCLFEIGTDDVTDRTLIEMQKDKSSGIWFPSKEHNEFIQGGQKKWTKTYKITDAVLNEPVTDEQICFEIPKGANITNNINNKICGISEPFIGEDIL